MSNFIKNLRDFFTIEIPIVSEKIAYYRWYYRIGKKSPIAHPCCFENSMSYIDSYDCLYIVPITKLHKKHAIFKIAYLGQIEVKIDDLVQF